MGRFQTWLTAKFLPQWAKQTLLADNAALAHQLAEERRRTAQLRAVIHGMERALRLCGRSCSITEGMNYNKLRH